MCVLNAAHRSGAAGRAKTRPRPLPIPPSTWSLHRRLRRRPSRRTTRGGSLCLGAAGPHLRGALSSVCPTCGGEMRIIPFITEGGGSRDSRLPGRADITAAPNAGPWSAAVGDAGRRACRDRPAGPTGTGRQIRATHRVAGPARRRAAVARQRPLVIASRFWAFLAVFTQSFGTKSRIDSGCQALDTPRRSVEFPILYPYCQGLPAGHILFAGRWTGWTRARSIMLQSFMWEGGTCRT